MLLKSLIKLEIIYIDKVYSTTNNYYELLNSGYLIKMLELLKIYAKVLQIFTRSKNKSIVYIIVNSNYYSKVITYIFIKLQCLNKYGNIKLVVSSSMSRALHSVWNKKNTNFMFLILGDINNDSVSFKRISYLLTDKILILFFFNRMFKKLIKNYSGYSIHIEFLTLKVISFIAFFTKYILKA